jgi:hypothetical protein
MIESGEVQTYTTLGVATERSNNWAKLYIDTLATVLLAHLVASTIPLTTIPGRSDSATCREGGDIVGEANTERAILHAYRVEAKSWNGAHIADAVIALPACACGDVDFLEESELADECLGLRISLAPVTEAFNPSARC